MNFAGRIRAEKLRNPTVKCLESKTGDWDEVIDIKRICGKRSRRQLII